MSKEAMKLALEALRKSMQGNLVFDEAMESFKALEEALAKQEQGEPCGWQYYHEGKWHNGMETNNHRANTEAAGILVRNVYPEPQQQRKPLSEAAIEGLAKFVAIDDFNYDFARAIEKAHGIKE